MSFSPLLVALLLLLLLVGVPAPAMAQRQQLANFPAPTTPTPVYDPAGRQEGATGGAPGRYQLADGTWHEAVVYEIKTDRVYLGEVGKSKSAAVFPEQIARFTTGGETYGAVTGFRLRRGGRMVPPAFARQVFDAGGYTLLRYGEVEESFWSRLSRQRLLLRIGNEPVIVLPNRSKSFNQLMLTIVGDNPALAKQLQANKFRPWFDAADILTTYVNWKSQQPKILEK